MLKLVTCLSFHHLLALSSQVYYCNVSFVVVGATPSDAINEALKFMSSHIPDADGGVIAIDKDAQVGYGFNSRRMAWAYVQNGQLHYGIEHGEDNVEPFTTYDN